MTAGRAIRAAVSCALIAIAGIAARPSHAALLSVAEVQRVIAQAVAEATARGASATIAVRSGC